MVYLISLQEQILWYSLEVPGQGAVIIITHNISIYGEMGTIMFVFMEK